MKYFLGVDMGGTNLRFGLVDENGKADEILRLPTKAGAPQSKMLDAMKMGIKEKLDLSYSTERKVEGIGIGVPGCVDFERGFIHTLVNVPGWDRVPLAKILSDEFNIPVFVDNDVNVMALGELRFGAARGGKNVICMTLGTGVGGGVIVDGKLYRGSSFTAGEVGHIVVEKDGPPCNCGNWGCLERFIGNKHFVDRAIELYRLKPGAKVPAELTPEDLTLSAANGDDVALWVWREAATYLGLVISGLVNFFNPDLVIIGGGMSGAGRFLFEPLEQIVRERSMKVPGKTVKIKVAELGADAGLIGAATLVMVESR